MPTLPKVVSGILFSVNNLLLFFVRAIRAKFLIFSYSFSFAFNAVHVRASAAFTEKPASHPSAFHVRTFKSALAESPGAASGTHCGTACLFLPLKNSFRRYFHKSSPIHRQALRQVPLHNNFLPFVQIIPPHTAALFHAFTL
jgi:hypothetical protein